MSPTVKLLLGLGTAFFLAAGFIHLGLHQTFKIGRLPGDIQIERPGMSLYFPVTTSLLISLIFWVLQALYSWFSRK